MTVTISGVNQAAVLRVEKWDSKPLKPKMPVEIPRAYLSA